MNKALIISSAKKVSPILSVANDSLSVVKSVLEICNSSGKTISEISKIRCATKKLCKTIQNNCEEDIQKILNQNDYAESILKSKSLSNNTKEKLLLDIVNVIQKS